MNEESIFSENFKNTFQIGIDTNKTCCVCFVELYYINKRVDTERENASEDDTERENASEDDTERKNALKDISLLDLEKHYFKNGIIPDKILVLSCCKVHYICIGCMRKLINNYEAHVINERTSHFSCPYPFRECVTEIGFKNVFDHNSIKKICISESEWVNYTIQAERFAFPGFTIVKCPLNIYKRGVISKCNSKVLVENNLIKTVDVGDLIVECSQNERCLKKFCFSCKKLIHYYQQNCYECKTSYENENPNVYNYYFNKRRLDKDIKWGFDDDEYYINQSEYLYLNNEITVEIATDQILSTIKNIETQIICSICKISLYKTERCNGLSHHNLERCYSCSRIGYDIKGLDDHWGIGGVDGCFRFDNDSFVKKYVPEYICDDSVCSNHEKGDCTITEHQIGIEKLNIVRKRAYVYHMLKSLLCDVKFQVYDNLYNICKNNQAYLNLLPYKQTLILLNKFKKQYRNYCEDIVYKQLHCKNALEIFTNKMEFVSADEYVEKYYIGTLNEMIFSDGSDNGYMLTDTLSDSNSSSSYYFDRRLQDTDVDIYTEDVIRLLDTTEPENVVVQWRPEENVDYSETRDSDHLTRLLDLLQYQLFHNLERSDLEED
jgi:hypothetical protein